MPRKIVSITKEELEKAYIAEEKSLKDIGLEFSCSAQTILNLLRKYEIPSRTNKTHTEKTKAKLSELKSGENNHYYNKKRPDHSTYLKGKKPYTMTDEIRKKMSESASGKIISEETRKKMSEANRKRFKQTPVSEETRKKLSNANMGKHHSEEARKKMSIAKNGLWGGKYAGETHPNWKPPSQRKTPLYRRIRSSAKMQNWRKSVFERDNWTCQSCHIRGGVLNADHIETFAKICTENKITNLEEAMACEKLWSLSNGRTLCLDCHKKTDTFAKHI